MNPTAGGENLTLGVEDWLDVIDREYLSTFIKDGGSAVKFAVTPEAQRSALREKLRLRSENLDYATVVLHAEQCRVHMPQDIFYAMASQLDWRLLARRLILRLLEEKDYYVEGIDPENTFDILGAVAQANDLDPQFILPELRLLLQNEVFKNPNMMRAFRLAMLHLCRLERGPPDQRTYAGQPLLDWLTGVNPRIGSVRHFQIHTPINRTTARYFIESTLYWVRHAGHAGTLIMLDNARVTIQRNPRDGQRYFTRAMTMDHYEVLRELIDDADRLPGLLLIVITDEKFTHDDPQDKKSRGWGIYQALQTRVMDDVRDRHLVNPVAALVRLP